MGHSSKDSRRQGKHAARMVAKSLRKAMVSLNGGGNAEIPGQRVVKGIKRLREVDLLKWIYYLRPGNPPEVFILY